jgi:hypothetical protein
MPQPNLLRQRVKVDFPRRALGRSRLGMLRTTYGQPIFLFSSAVLCLVASEAYVLAAAPPKQDRIWRRYSNAEHQFCVSYPARWYKGEIFDGSGLSVASGAKKHSRPTGEIDVSVLSDKSTEAVATPVSLSRDLEDQLEQIKRFVRAQAVEVLEKRSFDLLGSPALFIKERYFDPQDRATWMEELVFTRRANVLYRLELECHADQIERFEPIFTTMVRSFQFDCAHAQ